MMGDVGRLGREKQMVTHFGHPIKVEEMLWACGDGQKYCMQCIQLTILTEELGKNHAPKIKISLSTSCNSHLQRGRTKSAELVPVCFNNIHLVLKYLN
jgi:hypothetical protein